MVHHEQNDLACKSPNKSSSQHHAMHGQPSGVWWSKHNNKHCKKPSRKYHDVDFVWNFWDKLSRFFCVCEVLSRAEIFFLILFLTNLGWVQNAQDHKGEGSLFG